MNTSAVQMLHATVVVAIEFEKYISTFESLLGKYDPTVADQIHKDPQAADLMLQAMEGEQNLMIFWKLNHGGLFSLIGRSDCGQAGDSPVASKTPVHGVCCCGGLNRLGPTGAAA
jgi:hypothetical protein